MKLREEITAILALHRERYPSLPTTLPQPTTPTPPTSDLLMYAERVTDIQADRATNTLVVAVAETLALATVSAIGIGAYYGSPVVQTVATISGTASAIVAWVSYCRGYRTPSAL